MSAYVYAEGESFPVNVIVLNENESKHFKIYFPVREDEVEIELQNEKIKLKKKDLLLKKSLFKKPEYYFILNKNTPLQYISPNITPYTLMITAKSKILGKAMTGLWKKPWQMRKLIFIAVIFIVIGFIGMAISMGWIKI